MKYCSNCGKLLEIELDFHKSFVGVTFIKQCKHCKYPLDRVTVKNA